MMNIYEAMSNRTINIEKDLDGRMWYITDNVTDVVGKGPSRTSALACYNRGIELWQMRQAGYDITDCVRLIEEKDTCLHWECPYKCCTYHENYDESAYKSRFWDQGKINPFMCTRYLDV